MVKLNSFTTRSGLFNERLIRFSGYVQNMSSVVTEVQVNQLLFRMEKIKELWQDFDEVSTKKYRRDSKYQRE